MTFFSILNGIIIVLTFIFLIVPSSLELVRKMDHYRLAVLCIFIASLIYWVYFLIVSLIQHRNPIRVLMNLKENTRIIRNPDGGHCYLVEGNTCVHIPDPETFDYLGRYLGFSRAHIKTMTTTEIERKFKIGKQLPSIKLHFPKTESKESC